MKKPNKPGSFLLTEEQAKEKDIQSFLDLRSKRNPDKFCVFDKDGNEVKLFDKEADAIAYAKANHDKLMEELNEKKAKFLRLKFANNQTVKKAERWLYKILS